jgi:hypothetical protein
MTGTPATALTMHTARPGITASLIGRAGNPIRFTESHKGT